MDTPAIFLASVLKSKLIAREGEKLEGVPWPLLLPRSKDMETFAPWEARTPDLEVNSLTLWPTELRKLVHRAEKSWFSAKASPSPDVLVLAWQLPSHSLHSDAPWEARSPDLEVNSVTL